MRLYYEQDGIRVFHGDILDNVKVPAFAHTTFAEWLFRCADVLVTDPPYGIGYASNRPGTSDWHGVEIANDRDTSARDAVLNLWGDKPALVFGTWRAPRPERTRTVLIWDKGPALGMGALDLPWKPSYEEIYVLGKGFHGRRDGAVIHCPPVQSMAKNGRVHPNEKPVALMRELLGKCPAGVIIDPYMGSGTTLRAAKDLGRKAIGIEIEERYCEIAARRLEQAVLPLAMAD